MAPLRPPAVIVGFENNGLGVARALHRCQIQAIGITGPDWTASLHSRAAKIVRCSDWSAAAVLEKLIELGRDLPAKAPLLITQDEPVLWIAAQRGELDRYYEINLPPSATVDELMDKRGFHEIATRQGWPLPTTWRFERERDVQAAVGEIVFPCILKPAVKNTAFRNNSPQKAFKAYSAEELLSRYRMVAQWEPEVVIQEWIGGGDEQVAFVLGYWNRDAEALGLFPGRKLRQWPPECGNTAIAVPAPAAWRAALLELTSEIYKYFRYQGLGSIEYKMRADGRPVIMEPTVGRTNYQNEVAVLNGVNLPAIAYFDLAGRKEELQRAVAAAQSPHPPMKWVDGMADYRAARHYMREGQLTFGKWMESRSGRKSYVLFRVADPMPFAASVTRTAGGQVKRFLRKLLGR